MRTFQSRGATIALLVAVAIGFFFAGYCARAIRVAEAASPLPIVTPPPPDGNPVGHKMMPPKNFAMAKPPPNLKQCLQLLAKHPIAIVYRLAPPGGNPWLGAPPTCAGQAQPCVPFHWQNVTIQVVHYPNTPSQQKTVDVWGTLSK
jgi:hypothetical protein